MKKCGLTLVIFTVFFFLTSMAVLAETDVERLDRLEREIKDLKAKQSTGEKVLSKAENVWSRYNMRIYGRVKVDMNYDTAEFEDTDWMRCVKARPDNTNDSTNFNPRDSRFGFDVSHTKGDWAGSARIELDFYGDTPEKTNNLEPRMRLGYVKAVHNRSATSIVVGQDWIPVAQLNPAIIDFGTLSAAGNLWWRIPQVTIRQKLGDMELLVSAMRHKRKSSAEENRMPWALGRVEYNMNFLGEGNMIAMGGGWRPDEVDQVDTGGAKISGTARDIDRWLVALELKLTSGPLEFKLEPWWGEGIGNSFLRYHMDVNSEREGAKPKVIEAKGFFADLTLKASDRMSYSIGYGVDDPHDRDVRGMIGNGLNDDHQFTRNVHTFVNTWYKLTGPIKVGAEIMYVETERFNKTDAGLRYILSMFYKF
jgi:hypothetical protein